MPQDTNTKEAIAGLLNRRPMTGPWRSDDPLNIAPKDLPNVPVAPLFRQGTEVIGNARLQQAVESLFQLAPELRGRINRVQAAPTESAIDSAYESKLKPSMLPDTNMLGEWDYNRKSIYLNPSFGTNAGGYALAHPLESTLAHEFGHAANYRHGKEIDELEKLGSQMVPDTVYSNAVTYGRRK